MIWHRYAILLTYAAYLRQLEGCQAEDQQQQKNQSLNICFSKAGHSRQI